MYMQTKELLTGDSNGCLHYDQNLDKTTAFMATALQCLPTWTIWHKKLKIKSHLKSITLLEVYPTDSCGLFFILDTQQCN